MSRRRWTRARASAPSPAQAHYLLHVMRAKAGDRVSLFNGRDGEWVAALADVTKRGCMLVCESRMAGQDETPDLWLVFAPVKKTPADYVTQKATELGVRVLLAGADAADRRAPHQPRAHARQRHRSGRAIGAPDRAGGARAAWTLKLLDDVAARAAHPVLRRGRRGPAHCRSAGRRSAAARGPS